MTTRPGGAYGGAQATPTLAQSDQGASEADEIAALVGRVLDGRFRLERALNAGGMGIIFEATQLTLERKVAIKVLRPSLAVEPDLKRRFAREVDLVSTLDHPHIVGLIDAGTDHSGLVYMVLEFVEGRTFREALQAQSLSLHQILDVFQQTCDALIEAHHHQIIHRDLKFDNIMLRTLSDDRLLVQVLDFGVAKALDHNDALTRGGQVPGTPGIIAPELIDERPPSPRSDLYSLGVLLFTALAGRTPFEGRNELELMHAHKFLDVPNLRELLSERVPETLIELTYELLEKDPKRRPATAIEVRDRLERIAEHIPTGERHRSYVVFRDGEAPRPIEDVDSQLSELERIKEARASSKPAEREAPGLAPSSIVTSLIIVLIAIIVVLIYLVYTVMVLPKFHPSEVHNVDGEAVEKEQRAPQR